MPANVEQPRLKAGSGRHYDDVVAYCEGSHIVGPPRICIEQRSLTVEGKRAALTDGLINNVNCAKAMRVAHRHSKTYVPAGVQAAEVFDKADLGISLPNYQQGCA